MRISEVDLFRLVACLGPCTRVLGMQKKKARSGPCSQLERCLEPSTPPILLLLASLCQLWLGHGEHHCWPKHWLGGREKLPRVFSRHQRQLQSTYSQKYFVIGTSSQKGTYRWHTTRTLLAEDCICSIIQCVEDVTAMNRQRSSAAAKNLDGCFIDCRPKFLAHLQMTFRLQTFQCHEEKRIHYMLNP